MSDRTFKTGKHYKLTSKHGEVSIAYYYFNPDTECNGFGFNIADGGGFLPDCDLTESSVVEEIVFTVK